MKDSKRKINMDIDDEVIAVISAAIAAMRSRPGYKLVVRSMRHVDQNSPAWNIAGRLERMRSK